MACDVLLIVAMIAFLLKYWKTMQAMLTAFLQSNTKNNAIQAVQADRIGGTYPLLFMINLPKEEEIIDDLREITTMEYVVQVIMIIVWIAIVLIIMYYCCMKCRHTRTIFKYCFPFLPISRIVREIKLIARLLDQMYVIEPPVFSPKYDDASPSAPQFPEHLHSLLTRS